MRIPNLLIVLFILCTIPGYSVLPKDDKKKAEDGVLPIEPVYTEGIIYALPRTGFNVQVTVQKTEAIPGPYFQFAEKYLGLKNVINAQNENWKIISLQVEPFTEADPNAIFKAMDTIASQISLLANGVIAGIKVKGTDENLSINGSDFIVKQPAKEFQFTDLSSDDFYVINVNPDSGEESMETKSLEDKAREAADYLIRLRKKRAYTILDPSDVIPEDGLGYQVFINEAQRLEKEYVALFAGKQMVSKQSFTFSFVPEANDVKNEILFRFSDEKGVLAKTDISGKPIVLSLTKAQDAYKTANQLKNSENPQAGESGIFYRIPMGATLKISDGLSSIYEGKTALPQFGVFAPVPENLLDGNYAIQFNTKTGTIREIAEIN